MPAIGSLSPVSGSLAGAVSNVRPWLIIDRPIIVECYSCQNTPDELVRFPPIFVKFAFVKSAP